MSGLAVADLRHEWVLTACMVLAIAAIVAPLLLLLGLRHGSIETLRNRLVENPVYRAIWPGETMNLDSAWFERVGARGEVEFLIPTILRGASLIRAHEVGSREFHNLDLIPTAPGDPLIIEHGGQVPDAGEVVLTRAAAEQLGAAVGEDLTLEVDRFRGGRRESEQFVATVVSIIGDEADPLERVYGPLDYVVAVETYREGMAVPAYGWAGGAPVPFLSFDGLIVLTPRPLERLDLANLRIGTGFNQAQSLEPAALEERLGIAPPDGFSLYDLRTLTKAALVNNVEQVRQRLRGQSAVLIPYVEPRVVQIGGEAITIVGLSLDRGAASQLGVEPTPWGGLDEALEGAWLTQVLLPEPPAHEPGERLEAIATYNEGNVTFPLTVAGTSAERATVPLELLAVLRTGDDREITWDDEQDTFVLTRAGFSGFRLYVGSIDHVPTIYRDLSAEGLDVEAHVQDIERIQVLDRGLQRLFWLVALVGIVGGCAALAASLYAAVERKKRDLGVMRLMGLSRRDVFGFPVHQGVLIAALGLLLAGVAYLVLATVINGVFAKELGEGERICDLPAGYAMFAGLAGLVAALLSSLYAASWATRIEPAEAIREE